MADMRCRYCGCSHFRPCIDEWGETCGWAGDEVCSFCVDRHEPPRASALAAAPRAAGEGALATAMIAALAAMVMLFAGVGS